jgi:hypothetical protein
MLTFLVIVNTVLLVFVSADRIKDYFAKATWDDKLIAKIKEAIGKTENK